MSSPAPLQEPYPPGTLLRHYKGGLYRVEGYCCIEATLETGVLYRPLQGESTHLWLRPLGEFGQEIETASGRVPRFAVMDADVHAL
jgi:hypothetical protein